VGFADSSIEVLRTIDKMDKIGREAVLHELGRLGISQENASKILNILEIKGSPKDIFNHLASLTIQNEVFKAGVADIKQVVHHLGSLGLPEQNFCVDLSIARGLDYYTGTVYETILDDHPEVGSVCSGGRYDNLAGYYTSRKLPGVGISIGLTRLFFQLTQAGVIHSGAATPTDILVLPMIDELEEPLAVASRLRSMGIRTEIYLEDARFKKKMKYANAIGAPYVLIIGEDELREGKYSIKNMSTGEQRRVTLEEVMAVLIQDGSILSVVDKIHPRDRRPSPQ